MTLNTSTVVADTDILASQYNDLRKDVIELGGEYAVATGSGGAYAVTVDSQITSLVTGFTVKFKANHTYSGSPTLNINSIGAVNISNLSTITNGRIYIGIYDGTGPNFILFEETVEKKAEGVILVAGEDISEGDLISLNSSGEAVKSVREIPSVVDSVSPSQGFTANTNCTILPVNSTQAIAFYNGAIDLIEVDESNQSISIIDSDTSVGGTTSQYAPIAISIDTTTYAFLYVTGGSIYVSVVTVAGGVITVEDTLSIDTVSGTYNTIAKVDTNKFAVCYSDGSNIIIVGLTYSAGTITADSANQFTRTASTTQQWVIAPYATDEIIFFYRDDPGDDVYRQKVTFSGTVPIGGSSTSIFTNLAFLNVWVSDYAVGVTNGNNDNLYYSERGSDTWSNMSAFSASQNRIGNEIESYDGAKYSVIHGEFSGGNDTYFPCVLKNKLQDGISIITYNAAHLSVIDYDNNGHGILTNYGSNSVFNHLYIRGNLDTIQGIATTTVTQGNNLLVANTGVVGGFTGLTAGNSYGYNIDNISTIVSWGHIQLGTAVSATELEVNIHRTSKPIRMGVTTSAINNAPLSIHYHLLGIEQLGVAGYGVFIEEGEDKFLAPSATTEGPLFTYSYNTSNILVLSNNTGVTRYLTNEFAL